MRRNGTLLPLLVALPLSISVALPAFADYGRGKEAYMLKDYATALKEFKETNDARSQYTLGYMYSRGEGVAQDPKEAVSWYRKSAEQGNVQAMYRMGLSYATGYGVEQNEEEALKWYRKSAAMGFKPAKDAVARLKTIQK